MSETAVTTIALMIDGQTVEVESGTTIWDAARQAGVEIPVLCHDPVSYTHLTLPTIYAV